MVVILKLFQQKNKSINTSSGIYKILNNVTGKFYIGSAVYLKNRLGTHQLHLRNNKHPNVHLQRAWNKHGAETFEFWIIEICNKEDLLAREQYHIDNLKPAYNIFKIAGSPRGYKQTKESNEKRRIASTGRKLSEQVKNLLSIQKMGNTSRRNIDRWPHEKGIYCKCEDCLTVIKIEQHFRNKLRYA